MISRDRNCLLGANMCVVVSPHMKYREGWITCGHDRVSGQSRLKAGCDRGAFIELPNKGNRRRDNVRERKAVRTYGDVEQELAKALEVIAELRALLREKVGAYGPEVVDTPENGTETDLVFPMPERN